MPEIPAVPEIPPGADATHGSLTKDPATGKLFETLGQGAVVNYVEHELQGLLTAQVSHDAAFDTYETDFVELGWEPGTPCKWYGAFASRVLGSDLEVHGLITRGPGRGRHFLLNHGDMIEQPRLGEKGLRAMLGGPLTWIGNRNP